MRQGDTPKQGHPKAAACLWRAALPAPWVPARQPVFARPRLDLVTPSTCPGAPRSVRGAALSPAPILGVLLGGWGALGSPQGCGSMWDLFAPGAVAVGWRDPSHMKPPHWPLLWGSPPAPPPKEGLALLAPLGRVGAAMPHRCQQSLVLWHGQRLCLLLCQGLADRAPSPPPPHRIGDLYLTRDRA